MVGKYVCCDDNTLKGENLDIARILFRTTCASVLNESFSLCINGIVFKIKMSEDTHVPLRINLNQSAKKNIFLDYSSDYELNWNNLDVGNLEEGEFLASPEQSEACKEDVDGYEAYGYEACRKEATESTNF